MKILVRKRRFWWTACWAAEPLALFDAPTYFRARTRERAIEKCRRRFTPKPRDQWEEFLVMTPPPPKQESVEALAELLLWIPEPQQQQARELVLAMQEKLAAAEQEGDERERDDARVRELERVHKAEDERDDYRLWNEHVRVCEHHTQDVVAPVGDCLICNAETAEERVRVLEGALRKIANPAGREAEFPYMLARTALEWREGSPSDGRGDCAEQAERLSE